MALFDKVPHLIVQIPTEKELGYWLARFMLEVRQIKRNTSAADSLWNICWGLQRYLRQFRCSISTFIEQDESYVDAYYCFDSMMKEVSKEGIGLKKKSRFYYKSGRGTALCDQYHWFE